MTRRDFTFEHRQVSVYCAANQASAPVVYFIDFKENGVALLAQCGELGCLPFNLVFISHLHWDAELSPWRAGKIISKADDFAGNADALLQVLTDEIVPQVETSMGWKPTDRVLGGYSMSGLFALYAAFKTSVFSGLVCASGSLWFPEIVAFVQANRPATSVRSLYFSIGDKESKANHPYLSTTEQHTRQIAAIMQSKGVETCFELNAGNHFNNVTWRQARGLQWALQHLY